MKTVTRADQRAGQRELAEALMSSVSSIRRAARRRAGRVAELSELTGAQMELVRALRRRPGASVAEAAEELRLAPNTVSTLVHRLVASGVVERRADPGDRRVARLTLSAGIAQGVGEWRERRSDALADALGRLAPSDCEALVTALGPLSRLADALWDDGGAR